MAFNVSIVIQTQSNARLRQQSPPAPMAPVSNGEYEQYRIEIHRSLDIQLEGILRKW